MRISGVAVACVMVLLAGCGEPDVTTLKDLYNDERSLPAVYMVDGTGEQLIAAGDAGIVIHDDKLAWPALICTNPECPADEDPYLFIAPDPAVVLQADGAIGYDRSREDASNYFGNCPQCLETRDLAQESDEDRQRYSNFVMTYVLPETAQRREELAAARQAREEELRTRMAQSVD